MVYVYYMVPETSGLALEQVDEMFDSGIPPRKSASFVPSRTAGITTPHNVNNQMEFAKNGNGPAALDKSGSHDTIGV
ncbi:hypothetical protein HDU86_001155 [Geranomyces michiganensis]|nr:hypothetical protein HDU86_001155 [Geranomyces michiganensis]